MQVPIIVTDPLGIISYWNPSAENSYGWTASEVIGRNIMDVTVSVDTEQQAHQSMAMLNGGKSWSGEFDVRCRDGKALAALVTLSPIRDDQGRLIRIVGVSQDLSRRKQLDEVLLRTENQFYALANSLPTLCWMADPDGFIFWYNAKWYQYTGTTPEAMQGWGWQSVHDPEILPAVLARWKASIATGNPFEMEFPLRGADHNFRWFITRVEPVRDGQGRIGRWFGTNTDIDSQQRLLQSLSEARATLETKILERTDELNKANESLGELSARLLQSRDEERKHLARELHDSVGQMLAAISMNLGIVKAQTEKLDAAGAQAVSENAGMVQQIGDEIRTLSHLLHPPLLDEAGLASALRWYVEGFSQRSKIEVNLEMPAELARYKSQTETAIFRIVQECLTNIHRHSESKTAEICIQPTDGKILISAQDRGKGIPPERLRQISVSRGGVGFRGMAERVRYLGGTLAIDSDASGTKVTATLPVTAVPQELNRS